MDVKLDWSAHVKCIGKIVNQRFHLLRNLKRIASNKELPEIYVSIIRSVIEYASPLFTGIKVKFSKQFQRLHNRAH